MDLFLPIAAFVIGAFVGMIFIIWAVGRCLGWHIKPYHEE